jgi:hypothetical protein
MPAGQSVQTTRRGEFRRIMRALERNPALRARTPVVFCEGDSWFSTPLAMNLLDWLVFATPEEEARGVPIVGQGGLFFRAEHSGDLATRHLQPRRFNDLMQWYGGFDFDIALLSAGGNDFVADFLVKTFRRLGPMTRARRSTSCARRPRASPTCARRTPPASSACSPCGRTRPSSATPTPIRCAWACPPTSRWPTSVRSR